MLTQRLACIALIALSASCDRASKPTPTEARPETLAAGLGSARGAGNPEVVSAQGAAQARAAPGASEVEAGELDFGDIDRLVADAIGRGQLPGAVVAVGRHDKLLFLRAYGHRAVEPRPLPMRPDTIFDLASLTKPLATAASIMVLVEQGRLDLDAPVARYLPEFARRGKRRATVRQLMIHSGGLPIVNPLRQYEQGRREAIQHLLHSQPVARPGTEYLYSDIGYIVLGELVRAVSGQPLSDFSRTHLFEPLGMHETRFLLPDALKDRAVYTELRDDEWIVGDVHDPRAYRLGGVAGNAGLFSTAHELARFARMMLQRGELDGTRVLSPQSIVAMTEPHFIGDTTRALGWDIRSDFSSNRGHLLSARAFGHGGFTGTAMWIDPGLDLFVIFLSNRVHPDGNGDVNRLAGSVADASVRALGRGRLARCRDGQVKTGIDVLRENDFEALRGKRVGLLTNLTGRAADGTPTGELLADAPGVDLRAIFTPEHGFAADREGAVPDAQAGAIPVYSLFGKTRRPTEQMLEDIDVLVFDIQDVGTRFFTYLSTLHQALRAAAQHEREVLVLDRPNPITGGRVEGPLPDPGVETFVNYHPLPVRHGMTAAEIARLVNSEAQIHAPLSFIRMQGYARRSFFDQTGLPWIRPSPNIRSPKQALLYPAVGLLESTNLSVGRGTDMPFELLGAPWLDHLALAERLREAALPGVSFVPVEFTPEARPYRGKGCRGVHALVTDREDFLAVRTGLEIAYHLADLHPGKWNLSDLYKLVPTRRVIRALRAGRSVSELERLWEPELQRFMQRRRTFLLYEACHR